MIYRSMFYGVFACTQAALIYAAFCRPPDQVVHVIQPVVQIDNGPKPVFHKQWKSPLSPHDQKVRLLALTMWGECRSRGEACMQAVGNVVMNRAKKSKSTIQDTIWKRKQFSCWNSGDPNRDVMRLIGTDKLSTPDAIRWKQAKVLAEKIVSGNARDLTRGATFYHENSIKPRWVGDMNKLVVIGGHTFYEPRSRNG